jgi:hypothetical protein
MMIAVATTARLDATAIRRMIGAGTAWGLSTTLGLAAWQVSCGAICLSDIAITGTLATAAGILTIGPLAAFYPRRA